MKIILILLDAVRYDLFTKYIGLSKIRKYLFVKSFRKAYASSSWTLPSVVALLSGTYPFTRNPLSIKGRVHLAKVLRKRGYKTLAINSGNIFLNMGSLLESFDEKTGFYRKSPKATMHFSTIVGSLRRIATNLPTSLNTILNLLYALKDFYEVALYGKYPYEPFNKIALRVKKFKDLQTQGNIFLYIHVMDSHAPWRALPLSRNILLEALVATLIIYFNTPALPRKSLQIIQRIYEKSVSILAEEITLFIDDIISLVNDDIFFVITSDHGEGFGVEKYDRFHEIYLPNKRIYTLYYDQLHIPLIILTNNDKVENKLRSLKNNILISNIDIPLSIIDLCCRSVLKKIRKYMTGLSIFDAKIYERDHILAETPAYRVGFRWHERAYTVLDQKGYKLTLHPLLGMKLTNIAKDPYEIMYLDDASMLKDLLSMAKKDFLIERKIRVQLKLAESKPA